MKGQFTGRHMAAIMIAGFGIVIAVNFTMARLAVSTFGGVIVENSYIASQKYNGWLANAERQQALGWGAKLSRNQDNQLIVTMDKVPSGATITGTARHPLGRKTQRMLTFLPAETQTQISRERLPPGRWIIRLNISASGHDWRTENEIR